MRFVSRAHLDSRENRASSWKYTALLREYMALLRKYMALLRTLTLSNNGGMRRSCAYKFSKNSFSVYLTNNGGMRVVSRAHLDSRENRASSWKYTALLREYMALLRKYMALLRKYRPLLRMFTSRTMAACLSSVVRTNLSYLMSILAHSPLNSPTMPSTNSWGGCKYRCVYIRIHVYVYIYVCIYENKCTYIYIYICMSTNPQPLKFADNAIYQLLG